MAVTTGLASIREATARKESKRPPFFKLGGDETRLIRFVQELDVEAEYYDEEIGLGCLAVEYKHPNPQGTAWKLRAADTSDPEHGGRCWMAEQGWRPRKSLYIVVQEVDGPNAGKLSILNQGFGKSTVSENVLEFAENYGTLRDRTYKVKRTGSTFNDTAYTIIPLKDDDPATIQDVADTYRDEVPSWDDVLNYIPYDRQEAFFAQGGAFTEEADEAGEPEKGVVW